MNDIQRAALDICKYMDALDNSPYPCDVIDVMNDMVNKVSNGVSVKTVCEEYISNYRPTDAHNLHENSPRIISSLIYELMPDYIKTNSMSVCYILDNIEGAFSLKYADRHAVAFMRSVPYIAIIEKELPDYVASVRNAIARVCLDLKERRPWMDTTLVVYGYLRWYKMEDYLKTIVGASQHGCLTNDMTTCYTHDGVWDEAVALDLIAKLDIKKYSKIIQSKLTSVLSGEK